MREILTIMFCASGRSFMNMYRLEKVANNTANVISNRPMTSSMRSAWSRELVNRVFLFIAGKIRRGCMNCRPKFEFYSDIIKSLGIPGFFISCCAQLMPG